MEVFVRLFKRAAAALAATASIFTLLALAGTGTAAADPRGGPHWHPSLIDDITVHAPIDVDVIGNNIAILGVIDD